MGAESFPNDPKFYEKLNAYHPRSQIQIQKLNEIHTKIKKPQTLNVHKENTTKLRSSKTIQYTGKTQQKTETLILGCVITIPAIQLKSLEHLTITTAATNITGALTEGLKTNSQLESFTMIAYGIDIIQERKRVLELPIAELSFTEYTERIKILSTTSMKETLQQK